MKVNITMRQTHPNLWFAVNIFGLWGVLIGLNMLFTQPTIPAGELRMMFATAYLIFGTMKLIGANTSNVIVARAGMVGCMALSTLFSAYCVIAFMRGDLKTLYTAVNFFFLGIVQLAAISEPSVNPLTMKQSSGNV